MPTKPVRTSDPSGDVVTLAEVKSQLRIGFDDDDGLLTGYLAAAVDRLDGPKGLLGRFLLTQDWNVQYERFSVGQMRLPFVDVQDVVLKYDDTDGNEQTVADDQYALVDDELGSLIVFYQGFQFPAVDDTPFPITITMTVGYGASSEVPAALKVAIQMMVAQWYENPEGLAEVTQETPTGVSKLIEQYRVHSV